MAATATPAPRFPAGAALVLGVGLGGFVDGILLHQVLQWHHLLSNVDQVRDLRTQLLVDGLFHVLMYVLVVAALVRLARAWRVAQGSAQALLVRVLYGFALWQLIDAVAFHWVTGIHRIRIDVPNPLAWDIGWLVVFGAPPVLAALWLKRQPPGSGRGAGTGLAVLVVATGLWSAWPNPSANGAAVVLFAPGVTPAHAFDALARSQAQVRWVDAGGGVWAVQWNEPPPVLALLRSGALVVGGSPGGLGCVGWTQVVDRGGRQVGRQPV